MTNILVECPELISSVKIGVMNPLIHMNECNVRFRKTNLIRKEDISWCDILITVRGSERASFEVVNSAYRAKKYVIMFLDDDLINIPLDLESTKYFNDKIIKKNIIKILKKTHLLWSVNPRIAKKYSKFTINNKYVITKVPMKIEKENDIKSYYNNGILKVLYAGSIDHKKTIQKIVTPIIEMFSNELNKSISFTFIGTKVEINGVNCYDYFSNYEEYKNFVKKEKFDIGLAPIEISEFYKSKYYNKYLEYTSIGVLGIYTNSEPYNLVIDNGKNGFLCDNEPYSWYLKIKEILEDRFMINSMILNAKNDVKENFNFEKVTREILELIPEITTYKSCHVDNIKLPNLKFIFYMDRVKLLIRIYKLKSVLIIPYRILKKIKNKIFRRK